MPLKSAVQQDEVTMAQLCLDTSPIVANDTYRIDIFDASANGATAGAEDQQGYLLAVSQFKRLFYGEATTQASRFQMTAPTDTNSAASFVYDLKSGIRDFADGNVTHDDDGNPLGNGQNSRLKGQGYIRYGSVITNTAGDNDIGGAYLVPEILAEWKQATDGCEWSTCSEMAIITELIEAHDLQTLGNCNVCCSLSYCELTEALNRFRRANGEAEKDDVQAGDKISLSLLIKNSFPGAKDIEVVIHYKLATDAVYKAYA